MNVKKIPTIADVAEKAQVSKTTVSRYLNGKHQHMSETTKNRITDVIREMDYRPVKAARALKMQKSGMIGCIIADITSPFSAILVKGINDMCVEAGYDLIMINVDDDPEREIKALETLISYDVEGIIVNATGKNNRFLLQESKKIPIVMADRAMEGGALDSITSDNRFITGKVIDELAQKGFERIAFFSQDPTTMSTRQHRCDAYLKAVSQFLLQRSSPEEDLYILEDLDPDKTSEMIREFSGKSGTKAIFCGNGVVLLHVLQIVNEEGYQIPQDFGMISFDDWGWPAIATPPISTIKQDSYEIGRETVKQVVRRIRGEYNGPAVYKEVPTQLIFRASTTLESSK